MTENRDEELPNERDGVGAGDEVKATVGKVYLVGAGPGDPELLTLKGARALASSDVVLYDELVNPRVLFKARACSQLVNCGKRAGEAHMSQVETNALMIWHALQGRTVTRLKGGDPFVFGRGGEEAEALAEAGIPFEVVPGVTAGVAAAAYAGIPLTHRGYASSVAFVTGHDGRSKRRAPVDWAATAHVADTLVVFMCSRTIASVAADLVAAGRAPATPVAIVSRGTCEDQEVFVGTLGELQRLGGEVGVPLFDTPAVAIVGDVASLSDRLHWFGESARPLVAEAPAVGLAAAKVG